MNIYIVDADPEVHALLGLLLRREGHQTQFFSRARAFLSVAPDLTPGCALVDVCPPDLDGVSLQMELVRRESAHVFILLANSGEVEEAVAAMRAGALDCLCKPFRRYELFSALDRAEAALKLRRARQHVRLRIERLDRLSEREKEILRAAAGGASTKEIASSLDRSPRTIEMHRANIIRKLGISSFGAALVLAREAGLIGD